MTIALALAGGVVAIMSAIMFMAAGIAIGDADGKPSIPFSDVDWVIVAAMTAGLLFFILACACFYIAGTMA